MKKVVVDRSKWLRGEGALNSFLLRESDGKMCCLGFVLKQAYDKTDEDLCQFKAPSCTRKSQADGTRVVEISQRPGRGTPLLSPEGDEEVESISKAMEINDIDLRKIDFSLAGGLCLMDSEETREKRLIELLGNVGIELEFVG